jgi:hypothetical protein
MPTVEIVSIDADEIQLSYEYTLALIIGKKIVSHRGLFIDYLKKLDGLIMHIGNPECKYYERNLFWASEIIDWKKTKGTSIIPVGDPNDPLERPHRGVEVIVEV